MTAKDDKERDALRAAVLACSKQSDIARVLSVEGRTLRNVSRGKLGLYVSKDGTLTDAHKLALFDYFAGDKENRSAVVDAFIEAQNSNA
jgi:hypothetical protein